MGTTNCCPTCYAHVTTNGRRSSDDHGSWFEAMGSSTWLLDLQRNWIENKDVKSEVSKKDSPFPNIFSMCCDPPLQLLPHIAQAVAVRLYLVPRGEKDRRPSELPMASKRTPKQRTATPPLC